MLVLAFFYNLFNALGFEPRTILFSNLLFSEMPMCHFQVILNGSVTITPKEPSLNVPTLYNSGQNGGCYERPWFSILPLGNPIDHSPKLETDAHKPVFEQATKPFPDHMSLSLGPIQHQISALEDKLESVKKLNTDHKRMPVPKGDKFALPL